MPPTAGANVRVMPKGPPLHAPRSLDPAGQLRYNRGILNAYDICLLRESQAWHRRVVEDPPKPYWKRPSDTYHAELPPWMDMPPEAKRFQRVGTLGVFGNFTGYDLPLVFNGTAGPLFECDPGYDGVINSVVLQISSPTSSGFVQGSGLVTWRIGLDVGGYYDAAGFHSTSAYYFRDFGNVITTLGTLDTPYYLINSGLRFVSRQEIWVWVNLSTLGLGIINNNSTIVAVIAGWTYPR